MLGAIIGDIVGSRFEWDNYKAKDFEFFTNDCFFTDDSVMSLGYVRRFWRASLISAICASRL